MQSLNLEQFGKLLSFAIAVNGNARNKIWKRVKWEDSGKGILWPHLSDKDFDALMSATRPDETKVDRPVDVLSLSNMRQSSQRQMGINFTPLENSPGPRGAKGRKRDSNGNNQRRKKKRK